MSPSSAFILSGRFSRTSATPSVISIVMRSLIAVSTGLGIVPGAVTVVLGALATQCGQIGLLSPAVSPNPEVAAFGLARPRLALAAMALVLALIAGACGSSSEGEPDAAAPGVVPIPTAIEPTDSGADDADETEVDDASTAATAEDPEEDPAAEEPVPTPTAETIIVNPVVEGPEPLRIVALMGETGVMDRLDGPAVAGVVAEVERLNEQGGLLDRPITVQRIDTNSRASVALREMERVIETPPDLLIVTCDVEFSRPVLDLADSNGLVSISPCADDPGYFTAGWGARNFTMGAPAEPRGAIAADTALTRYGPTALVLRDSTSPEALRFCDGFESTFRALGGTVTYRDEFTYDTLEPLRDRLAERAQPTSSIVVCSHVPGGVDAAPSVISLVRNDIGLTAPIISGSTLDDPRLFSAVPVLGEMTYVTWSSLYANDPESRVNDIVNRANRNLDTPPGGATTILGAESVEAWARAVVLARSADPARVSSALGSFSGESFATGSVSFVGNARMDTDRTYRVMRVVGGDIAVPDLAIVAE